MARLLQYAPTRRRLSVKGNGGRTSQRGCRPSRQATFRGIPTPRFRSAVGAPSRSTHGLDDSPPLSVDRAKFVKDEFLVPMVQTTADAHAPHLRHR